MRKVLPNIFIGFFLITLLDSLGAIASKQMHFNYAYLLPVSIIIYTSVAFFIAKKTSKNLTIISTIILGLYDVTLGWKVSTLLQANVVHNKQGITALIYTINVIWIIIISYLQGLFGWWLASKKHLKNYKFNGKS